MITPISITGYASISPLGSTLEEVWNSYLNTNTHCISLEKINEELTSVAQLSNPSEDKLKELQNDVSHYKSVDKTVLMAVYTARKAMHNAGWEKGDNFGINMGSSRGATALFEQYHTEFLDSGKTSTLSSPTTTLGNISSWIANDLLSKGPEISHSITCSTALHSILNGVAWLASGLTDKFMVGGSEAPLTPFTIAQMKALKIYAQNNDAGFPCRALDLEKTRNQMFLGEGAAVFCLEKGIKKNANAIITGIGYATELLTHNISISTNANCFQDSMKMAMKNTKPSEVDAIIMHAPGTIKGDLSEYNAITALFGNDLPFLTTNKWKIGHSFGASGALNLELALLMIKNQKVITVPFISEKKKVEKINKVMVNAVGFGGNAVSILVELASK